MSESEHAPLAETIVGTILLAFAAFGVYTGLDALALVSLSLVALVGCVRSYTRTMEVVSHE